MLLLLVLRVGSRSIRPGSIEIGCRRHLRHVGKVWEIRHACRDKLGDVWAKARDDVGISHATVTLVVIGSTKRRQRTAKAGRRDREGVVGRRK